MGNINQTILPLPPSSLSVYYYRRQLAGHAARALSEVSISKDGDIDTQLGVFGVSISQLDDGAIDHIAFATDTAVYLIEVGGNARGDGALDRVFQKFLGSTTTVLAGFGMPRISLRLRHNLGYHVRGVDLSTLFSSSTSAWRPSKVVQKLCAIDNTFRVDSLWHENDQEGSVEKLCLRAWISAKVGRSEVARVLIENVRKVDTRHVRKDILSCLGILLQQTDVLARAVPRVTHSEHESYGFSKDGKMKLQNSRYKTRVRVSKQSYVEVVSRTGKVYQGEAVRAKGKTTEIAFRQGISEASNISSVRIVGLEEPTPAEKARETLLLRVLKDEDKLLDADFVRYLWFRTREDEQILLYLSPDFASSTHSNALKPYVRHLNDSQARVVTAMTSNDPIVIVHGPPGTGKTTTISSAAEVWSKMYSLPVWIIGHSNVSVKNIAEKLLKRDVDFKLIVSKEFYVEWHEHIYEKIAARLIRTDELPDNVLGMSRLIGSSTVILSTLGLLSNAALETNGLFRVVSVERLVIDEASQINVFEYMHIFHKFRRSLVKVCFFGDSKQCEYLFNPIILPPFGQERVKTLQSIFDIEYLKPTSYFLDVQYRLPVPLGEFISMKVYENQLKSFHSITQYSCVRFVDTPRGVEERSGVSWIVSCSTNPFIFLDLRLTGKRQNLGEISVIVNLIKNYYRKKDFCVITPYDAQRAAIEKQLKQENIPWEKVFNVDSFQGDQHPFLFTSHNVTFLIIAIRERGRLCSSLRCPFYPRWILALATANERHANSMSPRYGYRV
ncbi:P-loop containing nucleoside triphosphate hydrolase protein [Lentinula novae-zelandiae]|nr:P-loop containing nucleoside triphosphate hydrolase protein [Lentinula novae-zelandiae]